MTGRADRIVRLFGLIGGELMFVRLTDDYAFSLKNIKDISITETPREDKYYIEFAENHDTCLYYRKYFRTYNEAYKTMNEIMDALDIGKKVLDLRQMKEE